MNTISALLVKFVMTFLATWVVFGIILDNPLSYVTLVALLATAVNYILGDLVVLPKFGNLVAASGDGIMGALTAYIVAIISPVFNTSFTTLALFAVSIGVFEFFFHKYLLREEQVAPN
ncbi:MAG: DUF2512 family protein [Firmicutes bacterium]|nr:DUF2512 family protein [Bacillota bacterium]